MGRWDFPTALTVDFPRLPMPCLLFCRVVVTRLTFRNTSLRCVQSSRISSAVKRGSLAALVEAGCAWGLCYALVKTRLFEPKVVPRQQLLVLSIFFGLSMLASHLAKEWSVGEVEHVGRLLLPSIFLVVTAVENRFFQREHPDLDSGQWLVGVVCVSLTAAQVIVSNQPTTAGDARVLQLVVAACSVQACATGMSFLLWLRGFLHVFCL